MGYTLNGQGDSAGIESEMAYGELVARSGSIRKAAKECGIPFETFRTRYHRWQAAQSDFRGLANKNDKKMHMQENVLLLQQQRLSDEYASFPALEALRIKAYSRVLVFGDIHAPYEHPDTLAFLQAVKEKLNPELIINLGDELDYHAMSFHEHDPDLDSAGKELLKGRAFLEKLHNIFPKMFLVHSNHGSMKFRKAKTYGFPRHLLLSYADAIFGARNPDGTIYRPDGLGKDWVWADKIIFQTILGQDVLCVHGQLLDSLINVQRNQMCCIQGHYHSSFEIRYTSSPYNLLWGMTTGCLVDDSSLAFNYNKVEAKRPIIGCGAVIDGQPVLIPMLLERGGRWCGKVLDNFG